MAASGGPCLQLQLEPHRGLAAAAAWLQYRSRLHGRVSFSSAPGLTAASSPTRAHSATATMPRQAMPPLHSCSPAATANCCERKCPAGAATVRRVAHLRPQQQAAAHMAVHAVGLASRGGHEHGPALEDADQPQNGCAVSLEAFLSCTDLAPTPMQPPLHAAAPPSAAWLAASQPYSTLAGQPSAPGSLQGTGEGRRPGMSINAIKSATSLDELQQLYSDHRHHMRSGHVSAMLARIPHLTAPSRGSGMSETSKTFGGARTSRPATVSAATSSADARPAPGALPARFTGLLNGLLLDFEHHWTAGQYGPRELSSCAWVLGKLGRHERRAMVERLAHAMLLRPGRGDGRPQAHGRTNPDPHRRSEEQHGSSASASDSLNGHIAATVPCQCSLAAGIEPCACGDAEQGPRTSTAAAGLGQMASRPRIAGNAGDAAGAVTANSGPNPQDVSNMAISLARMGVCSPALWAEVAAAAQPQLRAFRPQELANLLWALAHAVRDSARGEASRSILQKLPWRPGTQHTERRGAGASSPWQPWLGTFLRYTAPHIRAQLRRFSGQELANCSWALATLQRCSAADAAEAGQPGVLLSPSLASAIAREAAQRPRGFAASAVSQMLWALGTLRPPPEDGRAAAAALVAGARWHATRLTGQGLANVMWGLQELGVRDKRLLARVARASVMRIEELKPLGLASVLGAWAQWGLYNAPMFAAAADAALRQIGDFRPGTLVRLLCAYATVGHGERRLFTAAAQFLLMPADGGAGRPVDMLPPATCGSLLCAYARLGVSIPPLTDALLLGIGSAASGCAPQACLRLLLALAALQHRPAAAAPGGMDQPPAPSPLQAVGVAAAETLLALHEACFAAMDAMSGAQRASLLWAILRLGPGATDGPRMQLVVERLLRLLQPAVLEEAELQRLIGGSGNGIGRGSGRAARAADNARVQQLARLAWSLGAAACRLAAHDAQRPQEQHKQQASMQTAASSGPVVLGSGTGMAPVAIQMLCAVAAAAQPVLERMDAEALVTLSEGCAAGRIAMLATGDAAIHGKQAAAAAAVTGASDPTQEASTAAEPAAGPEDLADESVLEHSLLSAVRRVLHQPGSFKPTQLSRVVLAACNSGLVAEQPARRQALAATLARGLAAAAAGRLAPTDTAALLVAAGQMQLHVDSTTARHAMRGAAEALLRSAHLLDVAAVELLLWHGGAGASQAAAEGSDAGWLAAACGVAGPFACGRGAGLDGGLLAAVRARAARLWRWLPPTLHGDADLRRWVTAAGAAAGGATARMTPTALLGASSPVHMASVHAEASPFHAQSQLRQFEQSSHLHGHLHDQGGMYGPPDRTVAAAMAPESLHGEQPSISSGSTLTPAHSSSAQAAATRLQSATAAISDVGATPGRAVPSVPALGAYSTSRAANGLPCRGDGNDAAIQLDGEMLIGSFMAGRQPAQAAANADSRSGARSSGYGSRRAASLHLGSSCREGSSGMAVGNDAAGGINGDDSHGRGVEVSLGLDDDTALVILGPMPAAHAAGGRSPSRSRAQKAVTAA